MIDPRAYMLEANNNGGLQGFGQGLQLGAAYAQSQRAQAAAQQEAQAKEQMNADLSAFAQLPNKTADDYAMVVTKYPQLSENYKRVWDMQDQAKKDSNFKIASQVYAATKSGQPEIAKGLLQTQAEAYRNSGLEQDAKAMETLASLAEMNPNMLLTSVGIQLAATNHEQFASISKALGEESRAGELQPYEVAQAGANINKTVADTAKTQEETKYIAPKVAAEISNLKSQAEDRTTGRVLEQQKMQLQNDQFYQNLDQNQAQFYETLNQNERKQAQAIAKVKETAEQRVNRIEKVQGFATAAKQAADGSVLAAKLANDFGAINESTGGYWNKAMRNIPGTKEYDFDQKLETLKSKVFLSQVDQMRGLGALTESEGAALKASIASINPNQSPKEVQKSLTEIAKVLSDAAKTANKKAQLFATKGQGYSAEVVEAARQRGISPAEMQFIATQLGL